MQVVVFFRDPQSLVQLKYCANTVHRAKSLIN